MHNDLKEMRRQLNDTKKQVEAEAEAMKIKKQCMVIARRIMKGDKVPDADHRFLFKNDPSLYTQAVTLKVKNDNPKKHKRLSEDEKQEEAGAPAAQDGVEETGELNIEA